MINLIGPYPPPYGGVSVHIRRLEEALRQKSYKVVIWGKTQASQSEIKPLKSFWKGLRVLSVLSKKEILHFHDFYEIAAVISLWKKNTIVTIHNERIRDRFKIRTSFKHHLTRRVHQWLFCRIRHFITVSENAKNELIGIGVRAEKIHIIPAYISPQENKTSAPAYRKSFMDFRKKHKRIVISNASRLSILNNVDLYGFDLCIEALNALKAKEGLGLVLVLSEIGNEKYYAELRERIENYGITENTLWIIGGGELIPYLHHSDIFLRTTVTDGFSLSLQEAIEMKIPTIASDSVDRPGECILFKNRDVEDLVYQIDRILANYNQIKESQREVSRMDYVEKIIELYSKMLC